MEVCFSRMKVPTYLILVLSALDWSLTATEKIQEAECTITPGKSVRWQAVKESGMKLVSMARSDSVCHCCSLCNSLASSPIPRRRSTSTKVSLDCAMFVFDRGESRCHLIDVKRMSKTAEITSQDRYSAVMNALTYLEDNEEFTLGISITVSNITGEKVVPCQSESLNLRKGSRKSASNRAPKTLLPCGKADAHFKTDADAPDVTLSDSYNWHMHQWQERNSFLKERLKTVPSLSLMNGSPPHVFFVFTSTDARIRLKARCALESALRVAKLVNVNVTIYSNHLTREVLNGVDLNEGITIVDYDFEELFAKTRLLDWYLKSKKTLSKDKFLTAHMSDAVRTALLWKKGGLYLDTDVVVMRDDIWYMPASVAKQKQTGGSLNGAVFKIGPYHPFTHELMNFFVDNFSSESYSENGPIAITKAFYRQCGRLLNAVNCPISCGTQPFNLIVFPNNAFYPVTYGGPRLVALFHEVNATKVSHEYKIMQSTGTFTIHLWASRTTTHPTMYKLVKGSLVERIFKDRCPDTHGYIFERYKEGSTPFNYSKWDLFIKQEHRTKEHLQGCFCKKSNESLGDKACGFHCDFEHVPNIGMLRQHGDISFGPNATAPVVVSIFHPDSKNKVEYLIDKNINTQKCIFDSGFKIPTRHDLKIQRQLSREAYANMTVDDDPPGYDEEPQRR